VVTAVIMAAAAVKVWRRPAPLRSAKRPPEAVAAADRFYAAKDVASLRAAAQDTCAAAPESALCHEVQAMLADLADHPGEMFDHLAAALTDAADDAADLHIRLLDGISWSDDERARARELFRRLAAKHPDPEIRMVATNELAAIYDDMGNFKERDRLYAQVGWQPSFTTIGVWDNDQGKAFDQVLPPENGIDLSAHYPGALYDVGWGPVTATLPNRRLDLGSTLSMENWVLGYAAAGVKATRAGTYMLMLVTTAPIKVWVNGNLVFKLGKVSAYEQEQFYIPIVLRTGANQLLIKSGHTTGRWRLGARIAEINGLPAIGLTSIPPDTAPAPKPEKEVEKKPPDTDWLVDMRVSDVPAGPRRACLALLLSQHVQSGSAAEARANKLLETYPGSIVGGLAAVNALWEVSELGRASDLLDSLAPAAAELPLLEEKRARFWNQREKQAKARTDLRTLLAADSHRVWAADNLAEMYKHEGWTEDRCRVVDARAQARPGVSRYERERAECEEALGRPLEALARYQAIAARRFDEETQKQIHRLLENLGRYDEAEKAIGRVLEAYPARPDTLRLLAETRRRKRDMKGADAALRRAQEISPNDPEVRSARARLAWEQGETAQALSLWHEALARKPSDQALVERLEAIEPPKSNVWDADVPDETSVVERLGKEAVDARAAPGADVLYLLDDEVDSVGPDGSQTQTVTLVKKALTAGGRDRLTQTDYGQSHARVLMAYALDKHGHRSDAASTSGGSARFRDLEVGSTVVLQYRIETPAVTNLSRSVFRDWRFQLPATETRLSRFVMWVPAGTTIHEHAAGHVEREEMKMGDHVRVAWSMKDVPPVPREPDMPPEETLLGSVTVSTVPDWDTFVHWVWALYTDVYRSSPELDALTDRLVEGATTPEERLRRIQAWVMQEIRYQQEYETVIRAWQAHDAPVVLERKYGDCKDKASLFMTMAHHAGIEARFALVRTRGKGPVLRDVPTSQFDHAIAYVPAQEGIAKGRFVDTTADSIDLDTIRVDDGGTTALVIDMKTGKFEWMDIPFSPTEIERTELSSDLTVSPSGDATGRGDFSGTGTTAGYLRVIARNPDQLDHSLTEWISRIMPGSTPSAMHVVEATDLAKPADVQFDLRLANVVRTEGGELRMRIPGPVMRFNTEFALPERKFPLVVEAPPHSAHFRYSLSPPDGFAPAKLPRDASVEAPCVKYSRASHLDGSRVIVDLTETVSCVRIAPDAYAQHRAKMEEIDRILQDELVLRGTSRALQSATR
jgi:tetratricopeptide (TPR) repeat protein